MTLNCHNKLRLLLAVGASLGLLLCQPLDAGYFRVKRVWNTIEGESGTSILVRTNATARYEGNHVDANDDEAGMHTTVQTESGGYYDRNIGGQWNGPFWIGKELRCTRNHNGISLYGCAMRAWIGKPWCNNQHVPKFYSGVGHVYIIHPQLFVKDEKHEKNAPKTTQMPCKYPPAGWDGSMPPPDQFVPETQDPNPGGGSGGGGGGGGCGWFSTTTVVQVCDPLGDCRTTWETYWDCV